MILRISSHVTIFGKFIFMVIFAFRAQLCMAPNIFEKSKDVLSKRLITWLEMVVDKPFIRFVYEMINAKSIRYYKLHIPLALGHT